MRTIILAMAISVLSGVSGPSAAGPANRDQTVKAAGQAAARPVYLVFYWRARPGKAAEYSDYIRTVAEPIDEDARKAGVFEEIHTYAPADHQPRHVYLHEARVLRADLESAQ